MRNIQVNKIY